MAKLKKKNKTKNLNSACWLKSKAGLKNRNKMNYETHACSFGVASGTLVY